MAIPAGSPSKKTFISLGAGVQSSVLALMCSRGELPHKVDAAIFADTQAEPAGVYAWLDWLEKQLNFPVYRVTEGNLAAESLEVRTSKKSGKRYVKSAIPMFIEGHGLLTRKCTGDYKITPIIRKQQELIGGIAAVRAWRKEHSIIRPDGEFADHEWNVPYGTPRLASTLIGISTDESHRMKASRVAWIDNEWPLIDAGMSRKDCLRWAEKAGLPRPPRSACVFCPYHSDEEWVRLRDEEPAEFQRAVEWEAEMHKAFAQDEVCKGLPHLHRSGKPLPMVKFRPKAEETGDLFGNECEGMCGV